MAGRPLPTWLTAVNYRLGGLDPFGYHAVNVLLHLANALLLFGLIRRTGAAALFAFSAALLWMVHPLATEAVNYVVQRTELMMAAALLATLYAAVRFAEKPRSPWGRLSVAACALGMASKEVMGVAPVLVLLYDRVFLSDSWRDLFNKRRRYYAALAATWIILAALLSTQPRLTTAGWSVSGMSPWEYLLTQSKVVLHYIRLSFWPHPLVLDYADWPVAHSWKEVWACLAAVSGLLVLTGWGLAKRSVLGFLGAWFFLILAPTSSIMPIVTELAAERRIYLPLAGIMVVVVAALWRFCGRFLFGLSVAFLALVLSLATLHRHAAYASERIMLEDILAKRPNNARAYYNLALVFYKQANAAASENALRKAIALKPDYAEAHNNLGVLLESEGRKAEALACYEEAVRLNPLLLQPHVNRESLRQRLKRNRLRDAGKEGFLNDAYGKNAKDEDDQNQLGDAVNRNR